jgi:serine/threonine protein kinase
MSSFSFGSPNSKDHDKNSTTVTEKTIEAGKDFTMEFTTSCGHTIKVKPVLKDEGKMQGKWYANISGPLVTGKSGVQTVYSDPSVEAAKVAASNVLQLSPDLLMKSGGGRGSRNSGITNIYEGSEQLQKIQKAMDNNDVSLMMHILKEHPEIVKERTPVVKDDKGNEIRGGELPLHIALNYPIRDPIVKSSLPNSNVQPSLFKCIHDKAVGFRNSPQIDNRCTTPKLVINRNECVSGILAPCGKWISVVAGVYQGKFLPLNKKDKLFFKVYSPISLKIVVSLLEACPSEVMQERTAVLKGYKGNDREGGELPLHIYLKYNKETVSMEVFQMFLNGSTECLKERTTVVNNERKTKRGGGEIPLHIYLKKNENVSLKVLQVLMNGSMESLNIKSTVLTDSIGNDKEGGKLPLHIYLKNDTVSIDVLKLLVNGSIESLKERTIVVKNFNGGDGGGGELPLQIYLRNNTNVSMDVIKVLLNGSMESLTERTAVIKDKYGSDKGGGELPINLALKNPNVPCEIINEIFQCVPAAISIKNTTSQRGDLPWTTIAANMKQTVAQFPQQFSETDQDGILPLSLVCALDPTQTTTTTLLKAGGKGSNKHEMISKYTPATTNDPAILQAHLTICQLIYHATPSTARDSLERNRDLIATSALNPAVRNWAKTLGAYLNRYRIDVGPPIHKSATCRVVFAEDLLCDNTNTSTTTLSTGETDNTAATTINHNRVALKIMKNHNEFAREITSRYGINSEDLDNCTIRLLGWHTPNDEISKITNNQLRINRQRSEHTIKAEYTLVMEMGSASLFLEMVSQRIAGHDQNKVTAIFRTVVQRIQQLHSHSLIHSDIKPRNVLRMPNDNIVLCDLDAALPNGTLRDESFKCSSAYCPPELAQFLFSDGPAPIVTDKFDVWSLGVVLYELCTGQHLFSQDISDDNMTAASDKTRLCLWNCISDSELSQVFQDVEEAKKLIRWCLMGDPNQRPTISQMLAHPYLNPSAPASVQRMRYHVFISHMQIEASGNVGTMFFMMGEMGCNGWRDMNQDDLTEAGMKQGVLDSDVFILFLTNSVLSRPFCLKEFGWALDAGKPIVIVAEEEERFWPFNLQRWMSDECTKDTTVWPHVWKKSTGLGCDFASCPENVKQEILRQHEAGLILPYRRRDFEANAMILQVLEQVGRLGCQWSKHVPMGALSSGGGGGGSGSLKNGGSRKLLLVCDTSEKAGAATLELRQTMYSELQSTLLQCGGNVELVDNAKDATHALVVLTGGLLREGSPLFAQLNIVVNLLPASDIVYTYSMDAGWDFGAFYGRPESTLKSSIAEHEALVYRPVSPLSRSYEHTAMVSEMLRRLRPKKGQSYSEVSAEVSTETSAEMKEEEEKMKLPVNVEQSQVMTNTTSIEQDVNTLAAVEKELALFNKLAAVEKELALFKQKARELETKLTASEKENERLRERTISYEGEHKTSMNQNSNNS